MLKWDDIKGQDLPKQRLMTAISDRRVASSYLFAGPPGVGKRSVAVGFAQQLNCETESSTPCGQCRSCRNIAANAHPDIRVVEPEGAARLVKIAQIRDVQKMLKSKPFEARYQVIIIDEADRMTTEASNALLKTLEEPPERARIVLVSSNPGALLDTIFSRCQTVRFARLSDQIVDAFVSSIAEEETDQKLVTSLAQGSPGRALSLVEAGATGVFQRTQTACLECTPGRPKAILEAAADLTSDKGQTRLVLDAMQLLIIDLLAVKSGVTPRVFKSEHDRLQAKANHACATTIETLWDEIELAQKRIDRNSNPQMIVERLLNAFAVSLQHPEPS